ncbi:lysophospholipid acyltransferase family protein [Propionivibrio sp.]|uniref:lysophospholipid acyltransferase family protein n=1 Tax=Propionivibrio sp. TaxID=2212460 RepID=UPI00261AFC41|nr:lysophospholipid acyltransferase family protein [Propionivibrio sp.]
MIQVRPTPYLIRVFRGLRLGLHFAWIALGTALLYPLIGTVGQARLKQRWSLQTLKILCVRLETQPSDAPPGSLIVANHVSWLDIFVINTLRPAAFVAKAEIRQWPFIGWLGARNDTVFLHRGSRGHAKVVNGEINALLNTGVDVAIFPEGTTTDGTHMLSFHAALLQPVIETRRPVLPLALSYHDEQGNLSQAPSFAGNTTLSQCFLAIFACRSLTARLRPAPAIDTSGQTRRELSQAAHAAIATRLGFLPASNPSEKLPDPQAG